MPSPFIESILPNMRLRGYSLRTEKFYLYWVHRFICLSTTAVILNKLASLWFKPLSLTWRWNNTSRSTLRRYAKYYRLLTSSTL